MRALASNLRSVFLYAFVRVVGATDECRHHSGDAPITNAILVALGNTCRMFSKSFGRSNVLETVASFDVSAPSLNVR
jgi:hypothetical protein